MLPRGTLYSQTLALTSPTSGGRSVGIVRSRTQDKDFFLVFKRFRVRSEDLLDHCSSRHPSTSRNPDTLANVREMVARYRQ
jgi:hypothetical protein